MTAAPGAPPRKWQRILSMMLAGQRLTRYEAEAAGDHSLPTTVCAIQRHGVRIDRQLVERPGRFGSKAVLAEYWLAEDQRERARSLLAQA
jgi:hypothetical protein